MRKIGIGLLAMALAISACGEESSDEPRNVAIEFAAMVGDAPFVCGQSYDGLGSDGTSLELVDFRFYIQDVELKTVAGSWVAVELEPNQFQTAQVALLDFEDGCGEVGNDEMNDRVVGSVPSGRYDGVRFRVGVPTEVNHADASTATGPLGITALFWNWRGGYKFIRNDSGNIADNPAVWRMHLGSTGCGMTSDPTTPPEQPCASPNRVEVELENFDVDADTVIADFEALVEGAPLQTNAEGTPAGCMSAPDDTDCEPIFKNLGLAFAQRPDGRQTFFTVEETR